MCSPFSQRAGPKKLPSNLVDNALHHTPSGGRVDVIAQRPASPIVTPTVTIEVRDTGSGIPVDQLDHIFDRFARVDGPRMPAANRIASPGAGLGLAIVRQRVALHGGTITVTSAVGQGTVFAVALPAAET